MSEYKRVSVSIESKAPTIMHNGQLADPLNRFAKAMKAITAKKKKTDEDYEELARLEFLGSLYRDIDADGKEVIGWPQVNLMSLLVSAARSQRRGKDAQGGLVVLDFAPLIYDGPQTGDELWGVEAFRSTVRAKIKGASIMRTRPIFRDWALEFSIDYDPEVLNERDLEEWMRVAQGIGLSDWRPLYGRFAVTKFVSS